MHVNISNFYKKAAFTLAEVLIVLGLLGIVSEMVIPTIMQETQQKEKVVALKEAYSILSQAFTMARAENGTPDSWGATDSTGLLTMFAKYLKIVKNCGTSTGCYTVNEYTLNKAQGIVLEKSPSVARAQLANGMIVFFMGYNFGCKAEVGATILLSNVCAYIYVDINGLKSPNTWGKDLFDFHLTKYGIMPTGTIEDTYDRFEEDCYSNGELRTGASCTG